MTEIVGVTRLLSNPFLGYYIRHLFADLLPPCQQLMRLLKIVLYAKSLLTNTFSKATAASHAGALSFCQQHQDGRRASLGIFLCFLDRFCLYLELTDYTYFLKQYNIVGSLLNIINISKFFFDRLNISTIKPIPRLQKSKKYTTSYQHDKLNLFNI